MKTQIIAHFDKLTLRERGLLLLVIVVLIYFFGDNFLIQPLERQKKRLSSQIQSEQKNLFTLSQTIQTLVKRRSIDPNEENRQTLITLREKLANQETQIQHLTQRLISPQNISTMLKSMLTRQTRLTLHKLENIATKPLIEVNSTVQVFEHSLRLELIGRYLDILAYVRILEKMPWYLSWDKLDIVVDNYPLAHVTLIVHSLEISH